MGTTAVTENFKSALSSDIRKLYHLFQPKNFEFARNVLATAVKEQFTFPFASTL